MSLCFGVQSTCKTSRSIFKASILVTNECRLGSSGIDTVSSRLPCHRSPRDVFCRDKHPNTLSHWMFRWLWRTPLSLLENLIEGIAAFLSERWFAGAAGGPQRPIQHIFTDIWNSVGGCLRVILAVYFISLTAAQGDGRVNTPAPACVFSWFQHPGRFWSLDGDVSWMTSLMSNANVLSTLSAGGRKFSYSISAECQNRMTAFHYIQLKLAKSHEIMKSWGSLQLGHTWWEINMHSFHTDIAE